MDNLDLIMSGLIALMIIVVATLIGLFSAAVWRDQMKAWRAAAADSSAPQSSPTDQTTRHTQSH